VPRFISIAQTLSKFMSNTQPDKESSITAVDQQSNFRTTTQRQSTKSLSYRPASSKLSIIIKFPEFRVSRREKHILAAWLWII
jgi:hypothetical protein